MSTPDFTGSARSRRRTPAADAQLLGERERYSLRSGVGRGEGYQRGDVTDRQDTRPRQQARLRQDGYGGARHAGYAPRTNNGRRPGRGRNAGGGNGGGGGRPGNRKGDWWRRWTWKKAIGVVFATLGAAIVMVAVLIGVDYASTPIPTDVAATALQQASTVYFSDGRTPVGIFGTVDRQVLSYNQIPARLRDAVVAAEDRNFYSEGGVSLTGILRAAYDDVTGSGTALQGGSTITQQFVRNYYANIGTQQTVSRKIKEIFVAIKLARQKSKGWILTQYLNTIYFGDGAYGVEAAAKTFFGKRADQLDVAQDAMLAAMINAPGQFDPTPGSAGYQALLARWHYVLQGMVTLHDLTAQQAAAAKFPRVVSAHQQSPGWTGYKGYVMWAAYRELRDTYHYSQAKIDNGGLKIVTTFSRPMMKALYATVSEEEQQMAAAGKPLPGYAHVGAVLQQPSTGAIVAMYSGPSYSEPSKYCAKISCQWDMALQNREQVGSSFKPYVLATARAQGMSVQTSTLDGTSPLCVPSDQDPQVRSVPATGPGQSGCPSTPYGWHEFSNDAGDSGLGGPQSVVYSTAQSLNTAYTDLTHRVGTQNVINMAKAFGVNTGPYPAVGSGLQNMVGQVGIALGTAALTVGEQASMFATLANDGEYNTPHVIAKIIQGTNLVPLKVTHRAVLTPAEAADVNYALSFDTTQGTGTNAAMSDGRPIIGKTGTTETAQSAFFLGAIPQYSLAVGMFTNNQNASTAGNAETLNGVGGLPGYGGDWPALIWHAFAEKKFAQLPVEQFATPSFGGSAWNLVGAGQQVDASPSPSQSPSASPRAATTCSPSPLNGDCGSPAPTSLLPTTSVPSPTFSPSPPTCPPGRQHCHRNGQPPQGGNLANGVPAADRDRALPASGG